MTLKVLDLEYYYQDGDSTRYIFKDLSVAFENGIFYTIVGESGSGKTTLLSLLGALDKPKKGQILLDDRDIFKNVDFYHQNDVGFVFQNYNLITYLGALENIELALDIAKKKYQKEKIYELLKDVGIDKSKCKRPISKLSGGEVQRIAIARALSCDPQIILADEPTGNLDTDTSDKIVELFKHLAHELNKCVIVVTHNKDIAAISDIVYKVNSEDKNLERVEVLDPNSFYKKTTLHKVV